MFKPVVDYHMCFSVELQAYIGLDNGNKYLMCIIWRHKGAIDPLLTLNEYVIHFYVVLSGGHERSIVRESQSKTHKTRKRNWVAVIC